MTQWTEFEKIVDILLKMPGMRQNLTIFSLSNLLVFFSFFPLITVHEVNCDTLRLREEEVGGAGT